MKKIIISENKLNTLLEYAGYADSFEKLVDYVAQKFFSCVKQNVVENGIDLYDGFKIVRQQYSEIMNSPNYKPLNTIRIESYETNDLITNKFRVKNILLYPSQDTCFNLSNSVYNQKTKMYNWAVININPLLCFEDDNSLRTLKRALQHELTHVYEYLQRYMQNGYEQTKNNFNNKYYNFHDRNNNIVAKLSYELNQSEINAQISEMYREYIDMSKEIHFMNIEECYRMLQFTNIGKRLKSLEELRNRFANEIDLTYQVMMWLIKNPKHIDMFPKVRNNSPITMQKRIVRTLDYKIKIINKKVEKALKKFLFDLNQ
jgi:hypothetical protein